MKQRPCLCDRCLIGKAWDKSQCTLCWLYHNKPKYKELWSASLPPIEKQAENFIQALVEHVKHGVKNLSQKETQERLAICETCDQRTEDWRCLGCGCYLTIKAKWAIQQCPLNKWPLLVVEEKTKNCGGCGNNDKS